MADLAPMLGVDPTSLEGNILLYLLGNKDRRDTLYALKKLAQKKSCKELCKKVPLRQNSAVTEATKAILANLGITEKDNKLFGQCIQQGGGDGGDLYSLLTFLSKHKDPAISEQVKHLKDLIKKANPSFNWGLFLSLTTFTSIGSIVFFHFRPEDFHRVVDWFKETLPELKDWFLDKFSILRNAVVFGMLTQSFWFLNELRLLIFSDAMTEENRRNEVLLRCLQYGLAIAGYAIMFLAAGVMTPIAAGLFISGAMVRVFTGFIHKTYKSLRGNEKDEFIPPSLDTEPSFEQHAAFVRKEACDNRQKDAWAIEWKSAMAACIVVTLWCFIPPSIPVSFACMAANFFILISNRYFLNQSRKHHAEALQEALKAKGEELEAHGHELKDIYHGRLVANTQAIALSEEKQKLISEKNDLLTENRELKRIIHDQALELAHLKEQVEAPSRSSHQMMLEQLNPEGTQGSQHSPRENERSALEPQESNQVPEAKERESKATPWWHISSWGTRREKPPAPELTLDSRSPSPSL